MGGDARCVWDDVMDVEDLNKQLDEVVDGAGSISIIEYPVPATFVGLDDGVNVTTTVCVVSDPSIVFVATM